MIDVKLIKSSIRYSNFIFLDKPIMFNKLFKDKNYSVVQIHDANCYEVEGNKIIVGFCGVFKWENNELYSLDYDSYVETIPVIAYEEVEFEGKKCLDILVESW